MIRVDKNEVFPILVSLIDENTGQLAGGQTVYYDIRDMSDLSLSPPIAGTLPESTVEPGIYKTEENIPIGGEYIIYATCSGFISNTEEVIVNPESIYELEKQNRHYNISVEDVIRENAVANASQIIRKVGIDQSDYTITRIKYDHEATWSGTTTTGIVYAHYRDEEDCAPFRMGGPF
jgi:hypothetical protein